jgi:hypothetical protein
MGDMKFIAAKIVSQIALLHPSKKTEMDYKQSHCKTWLIGQFFHKAQF